MKLLTETFDFVPSSFKQLWLYKRIRLFFINRFKLYPNLRIQLREIPPTHTSKTKIRVLVPLIETSHYVYYKLLILSKALEMRGAEILVLTCGSNLPGCEIKSIKSKKDPCMNCRVNAKNLVPLFNLNNKSISDYIDDKGIQNIGEISSKLQLKFESPCTYNGVDIYRMVNDSVTRYFYGNVPPKNSIEYADIEKRYIETAIIGIEVANQIHLEWRPNITFGFMDCYSDYAPYHKIQEKNKGHQCTLNITPFEYNTLQVNQQELYKGNSRFDKWMKQRSNRPLNKKERQILHVNINNRVHGNSHSKELDYFDESNLNLFHKMPGLFNGVIDWALKTAEIVAGDTNCHLYIKPHPAEVYDSATSL